MKTQQSTRYNLWQSLKKLGDYAKKEKDLSDNPLRCFISYAWGSKEDKSWVKHFADDLTAAGIVVLFDQNNGRIGQSLAKLITQQITAADFILVIGTPAYRAKSENQSSQGRDPVVAHENDLIHGKSSLNAGESERILPVILSKTTEESFPDWLLSMNKLHVDFSDASNYIRNVFQLIRDMYQLNQQDPHVKRIEKSFLEATKAQVTIDETIYFNEKVALRKISAENAKKYVDSFWKKKDPKVTTLPSHSGSEKSTNTTDNENVSVYKQLVNQEEDFFLINKIQISWKTWCHKENIAQLLHLYISSDCSNSQNYSEGSRYPLNKAAQDFLNDKEQQILLVLGDSGSGKTSLTLKLEQSYWETHSTLETMNGYTPIRIELKSYTTKTINQCVEDTLEKKYELTKDEINQLKKSRDIKLLIIFDGYDEIGGREEFNLYNETKLSEWKCEIKSVVTCRSQHFTGEEEFKKRFILCQSQTNTKLNESLKLIYVAPFSEAQMTQYLVQYSAEYAKKKDSIQFPLKEIQKLLKTQIEFKTLLSNPFVLKIFSDVAPKLLQVTDTSKSEKVRKINRAKIYQAFLEDWFFRAKVKLEESVRVSELNKKPKDVERYFFGYAQRLAYAYFMEGITKLEYKQVSSDEEGFEEYREIEEGNVAFKEFFGSEKEEVVEARKACPLRRSGENTYSFVHKSFQDYLVGRHLYLVLKSWNEKLTLAHWNTRYLSEDRSVLRFISELIENDEKRKELEERLLQIVKSSSKNEAIDAVSSNAISVLNWNRYSFSEMDLRGIRIPKAYLEGVNFSGANLSKSILKGSYVRNSEWSEANLEDSDLRGLAFGEYPDWEHESQVSCLTFNKEGTQVASGDKRGVLSLWSYPEGVLLRQYRGHTQSISSVAFSSDGKRLASGSWDKTIRLWDVENGIEERTLNGHTDRVMSVDWNEGGKWLVSGSWDKTIRLWDVENGVEERKLEGYTDRVMTVSWSRDGKWLASGNWDGTIVLWDVERRIQRRAFLGHQACVTNVNWSGDGKQLASASMDCLIRIWDIENWGEELTLNGHTDCVTSLSWSSDGKHLASGSWDCTIRLWDAQSGIEEKMLGGHGNSVTSVSWSSDGKRLASGSRDCTIRLWHAEGEIEERALDGHKFTVTSVSWSGDGKRLVSGSLDCVRLWCAKGEIQERAFEKRELLVTSVSWSDNGKRLASGSLEGAIQLWNAQSGVEEKKLEGHANWVTSMSFSVDAKRIVSASKDKTIRIWNAERGIEERVLKGHTGSVESVSFSVDGKRVASGSEDKTIRVWGVESGEEERALLGHTNWVTSVGFSVDDKRIASGSRDNTVRIWSVESGIEECRLTGHKHWVTSVNWSCDGNLIASGGEDRTIRLWDVAGGECTAVSVFNQIVSSVSFYKSNESQEEYLGAGIGNGVYLFSVEESELDSKPRLILKWRTEYYLRAQNANLENAKIDDINRRLLEQRGAKKSNPRLQSQVSSESDITSSSVQFESKEKPQGVKPMFIYWKKQPLTLALLSRWNKKELDTFKFNLIEYADIKAAKSKDNESVRREWLMLKAVITNDVDELRKLVEKDDYLYMTSIIKKIGKNNLLHWGCLFNCYEAVRWLLSKKVIGLNEKNALGLRAIHMAIVGDAVEVITLENWKNAEMPAVEVEVDANKNKKISCLPLPFAVLIGRERMMHHLLSISQYEESIESQATFGNILHLAVWGEHEELLQRLLYNEKVKKHNLYNKPDEKNRTALGLAVFLSRYMLMRILLQHPSIEVNAHKPLLIPIHIGVERGDTKAVRKLIHWGADKDEKNEKGKTPKEEARSLRHEASKTEGRKKPKWMQFNGLINLIEEEKAQDARERYRGELGVKLTKIENLTFRGGGGKAIAYGGALEEITSKVPDFWKNLRRVGGTSAGALTSLLISVGYLPKEVSNLLKSFDFEAIIKPGLGESTSQLDKDLKRKLMSALKLCATGIQGAYATKQTQSFLDVFLPLWKARKFTGLSDGEVLRNKLKELVKNALITQGFSTTIKDRKAYLTHSGKIIGENQPLLNQDLGLLTLGHWKMIVEGSSNSQHVYKHLYIVTSCVSGREMGVEVFNSESGSYDDVVMIDPVACSMSYPFAIEPQKVRRVMSDGQSKLSSESYLDGGMLMNDPKKLFDAHGYVDPQDKLGDKRFPRYNKKTLSLTLIPEKKEATSEFKIPEEKEIKTIFELIKVFASFYLHAETYLREQGYTERYREVAIPDCGVTVRDLNMSEENKKKLQDSGRSTMQKFMKQLGDPDKSKTLADDSKETFDPAQPAGPSIKKQ